MSSDSFHCVSKGLVSLSPVFADRKTSACLQYHVPISTLHRHPETFSKPCYIIKDAVLDKGLESDIGPSCPDVTSGRDGEEVLKNEK